MHDHFFDYPRPLGDYRLFGGLSNLNSLLGSGCKVSVCGWAVSRPAFDRDLLLAQAHRFFSRLLGDTAVDAHVAALDFPFAYGDIFLHHRNRDLFLALDASCARSRVRRTCRGAHLLLGSARRGRRARRWGGCDGSGVIAGPALVPPLCGPLVDIDRVQASQNLHATLSPVITTLDHHECAASTYPLRVGMGRVMRDAEVYERIKKVCSLVR
jgi:hypothetical protein